MYNNYVELKIEGLTRGSDLNDAYILVLSEKEGKNFLPILVDYNGFCLLEAAMNEHDYTCSRMMNQLARRVGMTLIGVRIMQPKDGETKALIDFELINEVVSLSVPVAEAVVAAMETNTSLWIARDLFDRQSRLHQSANSMALPITAMNCTLLEQALNGAVREENFELAGILRDELHRRNKAGNQESNKEENKQQ